LVPLFLGSLARAEVKKAAPEAYEVDYLISVDLGRASDFAENPEK